MRSRRGGGRGLIEFLKAYGHEANTRSDSEGRTVDAVAVAARQTVRDDSYCTVNL